MRGGPKKCQRQSKPPLIPQRRSQMRAPCPDRWLKEKQGTTAQRGRNHSRLKLNSAITCHRNNWLQMWNSTTTTAAAAFTKRSKSWRTAYYSKVKLSKAGGRRCKAGGKRWTLKRRLTQYWAAQHRGKSTSLCAKNVQRNWKPPRRRE